MANLAAILLAAGKGTRMKSTPENPKVLFEVAGRAMIDYPLEISRKLKAKPLVVVVGHGGDALRRRLNGSKDLKLAPQIRQLGSAHAVLAAERAIKGFHGDVLILSGDVPLLRRESVSDLLRFHRVH